MISKNQLKLLRALGQKKQRKKLNQFLVQGEKNVIELLNSDLNTEHVFASEYFLSDHISLLSKTSHTLVDEDTLTKVSTLTTNNSAIAVVNIPQTQQPEYKGVLLVLDGVSDPGNLGTIIRVADWYGISHVICSEDCADVYNPKTISATMGSFVRVNVITTDVSEFLADAPIPIYGAYLGGKDVHQVSFSNDLILMMGSESHGIRQHAGQFVTDKITIPNFGQAESLNVAMATGIILDNIKR